VAVKDFPGRNRSGDRWRGLLFALLRAGTEADPATAAVLGALQAIAAARPDGITTRPDGTTAMAATGRPDA
jgi:hypothetical protein